MYKNRYLIIGNQRSGTTLVHLLLKGHPNIAALNDELSISPFFTKGISSFTYGNDLPEEKDKGRLILFDAIASITANEATNTLGAKIAIGSPEQAKELVNVIQQYLQDVKVILIVRQDLVAQYGSLISGRRSGMMHSWYQGFENRKASPIKINKWLFTRYALKSMEMYKTLKTLAKTHNLIECKYEDFTAEINKSYKEILDFLELEYKEPTWLNSKKVMPLPKNYIKNYRPILDYLQYLRNAFENKKMPALLEFYSKVYSRLYKITDFSETLKYIFKFLKLKS